MQTRAVASNFGGGPPFVGTEDPNDLETHPGGAEARAASCTHVRPADDTGTDAGSLSGTEGEGGAQSRVRRSTVGSPPQPGQGCLLLTGQQGPEILAHAMAELDGPTLPYEALAEAAGWLARFASTYRRDLRLRRDQSRKRTKASVNDQNSRNRL